MYEWRLFCGESDFQNMSFFFPLRYPRFLIEISENVPVFLESSMGTLIIGHWCISGVPSVLSSQVIKLLNVTFLRRDKY